MTNIWTDPVPTVDLTPLQAAVAADEIALTAAQTHLDTDLLELQQAQVQSAAADPNSAAICAYLAEMAHDSASVFTGHAAVSNLGPAVPIVNTPMYVAQASDPVVVVTQNDPKGWPNAALNHALSYGVRIPAAAKPSNTSDEALVVFDPTADRYFEAWGFKWTGPNTATCWWGGIAVASMFKGFFDWQAFPGLSTNLWGCSASSIGIGGLLVTYADWQKGSIDHPLRGLVPLARASHWAWPAQRTDGGDTNPASIPEGAKLILDESFDTSTISHPLARMCADALAKYGMYNCDETHQRVGIDFAAPTPVGHEPAWGTLVNNFWSTCAQIPWGHLYLAPMKLR
jgi:hypothetical protein